MATATLSHSPFGASHPQQPSQSTPSYADNPLTALPIVDFNFADLKSRMSAFTLKFDAFIDNSRRKVLEERNSFRARLGEISEESRSTITQISTLQSTLSTQKEVLHREQSEKEEMQSQIQKLEAHQSAQLATREKTNADIAGVKRQIEAKMQAQREYAEKMEGQRRMNGPELHFWETYLGCRIDGAGEEGRLRASFKFPAEKGGREEREASFELVVPDSMAAREGQGYRVEHCRPRVDAERVEEVVGRMNQKREIGWLLKGMRGVFAETMG